METIEGNTDVADVYFEEEKEDPANSRIANPDSGRLIATPIL
tara:strand:+ start:427 stop:552 length:126 start_codon:yes stop_codon:yes gene_type:complete